MELSFTRKLQNRNIDRPSVVVKTSLGSISVLTLNERVVKSLVNNNPVPGYFLSGAISIKDYMLADDLEQFIAQEFGSSKARNAVKRLKAYLESCKTATKTSIGASNNRRYSFD